MQACLESIAFRMKDIAQALRELGIVPTEVRAGGSLAKIDALLQCQANLLHLPIRRVDDLEATCRGVARLVAAELGEAETGSWREGGGQVFEPEITLEEATSKYAIWQQTLHRERSRNRNHKRAPYTWRRARPWLIAHRGYSSAFPENTLIALQEAERAGAEAVEIDLRLSRDGYPVAVHDETLNRTTDGRGPVHRHDLRLLQQLDAGGWFSGEYRGEQIPTFKGCVSHAREATRFFAEIKPATGPWRSRRTQRLVQMVVEIVREADLFGRTILVSSDYQSLLFARLLEPKIQTGLVLRALSTLRQAERHGYRFLDALCPSATLVAQSLVSLARAENLLLFVWTVNDREDIRSLISLGVDGIITDDPPLLRNELRKAV